MQFIPTSPRPPSGMMRTEAGSGTQRFSYGQSDISRTAPFAAHREGAL
jgi:hypothetical protein